MPIAMVAVAAVGLGLSVYQTVDAKKKQKEAEKAAEEYERQELKNPYEDLQVSRMGADLQQENLNNQIATATDSLKAGGARAIIGGMPTLYDTIVKSNQQIAAGLDQQYNQNQQLSAQGTAMVQGMYEQREKDDLLGIGNAINTHRQEFNNGLTNVVQSGAALASSGAAVKGVKQEENTKAAPPQSPLYGKQPTNSLQSAVYTNSDEYAAKLRSYNRNLYGR